MEPVFVIIATLTLVSAIGAMSLRHPVHCALSLALAFAGLAAAYLQLHAQFVGFVQVLVYIGAVAVLIVFAILLTRTSDAAPARMISASVWGGLLVAAITFFTLAGAILSSSVVNSSAPAGPPPAVSVKQIGALLLDKYVVPLEVMGLLLTAALVGGVLIAVREPQRTNEGKENR